MDALEASEIRSNSEPSSWPGSTAAALLRNLQQATVPQSCKQMVGHLAVMPGQLLVTTVLITCSHTWNLRVKQST